MKDFLEPVNDIFFISERIKEINENYKLFYNKKLKRYEVHDFSNMLTLCVTYNKYPNDKLIKKLTLTKKENARRYIKEIEAENQKLEKENEMKILNNSLDKLNEVFHYAELNSTSDLSKEQIKYIIS